MLVGVEIRHMVIKYQVNLDNTGSNIFITYEIVIWMATATLFLVINATAKMFCINSTQFICKSYNIRQWIHVVSIHLLVFHPGVTGCGGGGVRVLRLTNS